MRKVLLAIPDLMFGVRVADVVRALGGTPVDVTAQTVGAHLADADLVVVETGNRSGWAEVVAAVRAEASEHLPVLAFGSHVDVEAQRAAVAAGCDRVVTRGKLAAELPTLLSTTAR